MIIFVILKKGVELDFMTKKFLVEVNYRNAELTDKQQTEFENIKKKNKFIVRDYDSLTKILIKFDKNKNEI